MEYRNLGRSGLQVSVVGLGTNNFGRRCDLDQTKVVVNKALDVGINLFDTADVYGPDGMSEQYLGQALEGRRQEVLIATKFAAPMGEGPMRSGGSRHWIMNAVEDSLRRLGTDYIDLYQVHRPDPDTPLEETLRALDDLVRHGKVLYIGASNYAATRLTDALWTSEVQGWESYVTLQAQYSLIVRDLEREHVPLCNERGIGILPWSPLAGGFLSGKFRRGEPGPDGARMTKWRERFSRFDNERSWQTIAAVTEVAQEVGATPAQVALAWLLAKPAVVSVIFGARSIDQLDDNLGAAVLELSDDALRRLDEASAFELGYPYEFINAVRSG